MKRPSASIIAAISACLLLSATLGCGSSNRQLQSITTNSQGMIQIQFTATGNFSGSPTTVTPLPVSWFVVGQAPQPEPYTLSSQPFETECENAVVVVAVAPANPKAPGSGTIPDQVFQDLVIAHTTTSEGGFIASSPQNIGCP
jgi:hypothetical protein